MPVTPRRQRDRATLIVAAFLQMSPNRCRSQESSHDPDFTIVLLLFEVWFGEANLTAGAS
jgi:hypothetical protein